LKSYKWKGITYCFEKKHFGDPKIEPLGSRRVMKMPIYFTNLLNHIRLIILFGKLNITMGTSINGLRRYQSWKYPTIIRYIIILQGGTTHKLCPYSPISTYYEDLKRMKIVLS
jgi:hypothetical protein